MKKPIFIILISLASSMGFAAASQGIPQQPLFILTKPIDFLKQFWLEHSKAGLIDPRYKGVIDQMAAKMEMSVEEALLFNFDQALSASPIVFLEFYQRLSNLPPALLAECQKASFSLYRANVGLPSKAYAARLALIKAGRIAELPKVFVRLVEFAKNIDGVDYSQELIKTYALAWQGMMFWDSYVKQTTTFVAKKDGLNAFLL